MQNFMQIKIGEKIVGLKFGLPAVRRINEMQAKYPLQDLVQEDPEIKLYNSLGVAHMAYAGYLNNCMVKEIEPTLTLEYFVDHFEQAFYDQDGQEWQDGQEMLEFFSGTMTVKSLLKQIKDGEEAEKKSLMEKTTSSRTSPTPEAPSFGTESNSSVMDS